MKVTFETGAGTVTGANFLLEIAGKRVLVDCGLEQGSEEATAANRLPFAYDPASIDMLFITHAHLDHVGRIPKLVRDGFTGPIYSTLQTMELGALILDDAVGLLAREAKGHGYEPLYEERDVSMTKSLWKAIPYHEEISFNGGPMAGGFSLYLRDAGHILGSSMFRFTCVEDGKTKNIVFTGDLGNTPTPILRDTESIDGAQYVVMESVYGDRNHEPKGARQGKLEAVIKDTFARGGTLVIPTFSIERTQVILFEINELIESGKIESVPVFVDSPLAIKVTGVYQASTELFNPAARARIAGGDDIFHFPKLSYTMSGEDSRAIDYARSPKIIIAGSGMSMGGRITHHEMLYLPDPASTVLLVGYQPVGTLGRHILDGEKKLRINGETIKVKAKIESILGYSAHKDSDGLVNFVSTAGPSLKRVFVAMGEPKAETFLAQRLRNELGVDAVCAEQGTEYEL